MQDVRLAFYLLPMPSTVPPSLLQEEAEQATLYLDGGQIDGNKIKVYQTKCLLLCHYSCVGYTARSQGQRNHHIARFTYNILTFLYQVDSVLVKKRRGGGRDREGIHEERVRRSDGRSRGYSNFSGRAGGSGGERHRKNSFGGGNRDRRRSRSRSLDHQRR